jgi:hypothetical protein
MSVEVKSEAAYVTVHIIQINFTLQRTDVFVTSVLVAEREPGSAVGIATERPRGRSSSPGRINNFFSST